MCVSALQAIYCPCLGPCASLHEVDALQGTDFPTSNRTVFCVPGTACFPPSSLCGPGCSCMDRVNSVSRG